MTRRETALTPTTVEEFERAYAAGSGVSVEWLHEMGRYGAACDCGYPECQGFQMRHRGDDD